MIELKNVSHTYKSSKTTALRDIELKVKVGEFVAIIGPNGSGKSTLAKMINGLLIPSKGQVFVDNSPTSEPNSLWKVRQKVGFLFQNPEAQIISSIVEEDIAFGPQNLGLSRKEIEKRIMQSLKAVSMTDFRYEEPHNLSSGQKQKIAIASVLALAPRYLVLDEPTSFLDPKSREEIIDLVMKLNKEQKVGVVLITHFIDEAIDADRIIVLHDGAIALDCPPKDLFFDIEKMRQLELPIPKWALLNYLLKKEGLDIEQDELGIKGLVSCLCSLI
ncbi:MAG: energy-coupling factor transporter ATPase [Actinobacteria bacterium]|nr:MAG: energy-coupling factor transporter ATPase [Actinomycetota bacterium]